MFRTHATRFTQNGRVFYAAAIPAAQLIALTRVDVWDVDHPYEGYQRVPSRDRTRAIAKYAMSDDALFPIGGLVNARPKETAEDGQAYGTVLRFTPEWEDGSIAYGELVIPDDAGPLFVVDMQHRLGGIQVALEEEGAENLAGYPLLVTIADGLSRLEEVEQFDLINTTQKKVKTDLARRLMAYQVREDVDKVLDLDQRQKLWEAKGPVIADILTNGPGVWRHKILPPNKTKKDMPTMIVREVSFVSSLKPLLQTPYFSRQKEEHAAELIERYWVALGKVFPEALRDSEKHTIQMTTGVFALHQIAPEVFELARDKGDISVESLTQILTPLGAAVGGSYFWQRDNDEGASRFLGLKGFRTLASILRQELPGLEPSL